MQKISDTRNLVLCGLCAAITCVLAPLSIPLSAGVPISLATFSVMLAGAVLGGPLGAASQLVYLLLGAVGLPVFAGWSGGIGLVTGMTGGYLVGYIPLAFFTGLISRPFSRRSNLFVRIAGMLLGMLTGTVILYAMGTAWFMFCTGMTLEASLAACVLPFLPGDLLKMAAVIAVAPPIGAAIRRASVSGSAPA